MRVVLSSNIPHYYHAAVALDGEGWLQRFITSIVFTSQYDSWLQRLPHRLKRKALVRYAPRLNASTTTSLWAPELLHKMMVSLGFKIDRGNWAHNWLYDWESRRYVDADCDVFHFVSSVGLLAAREAKERGARIVCDERAEHISFQEQMLTEEYELLGARRPEIPGSLYKEKLLQEYALADFLICPSSHARATYVKAGIPSERILTVPYGFDPNRFAPGPKTDRVFRVLYVGQIIPRKGIHYLIEAFRRANLPNAELVLVGAIDSSMLPILRQHQDILTHYPALPQHELKHHYQQASVFVLPSLADSYALVCLEAMASGKPVIVTANVGMKDRIEDGVNGFVVPIRDPITIATRLTELYENPVRLEQMSGEALSTAQGCTWDEYGRQLVAAYKNRICSTIS